MPDLVAQTPAWEFAATGTRWRVHHSGGLPAHTAHAVAAAVARDESRWSRFDPGSELSALNRRAGEWLPVSPETLELLVACEMWTRLTGGVFSPLVGRALAAWGYEHSITQGALGAASSPRATPILHRLRVHEESGRVWFPAHTALDLGGIGKGWMLRRAAAVLDELGDDPSLLLDAGGDMLAVRGAHVVAVQSADGPEPAGWVALHAGQAIATSGCDQRRWVNGDGRSAHHLLDPHTGAPARPALATVIAPDPAAADVLAKVIALRPGRAASCPHPALVQHDGRVTASPAWVGCCCEAPQQTAA